MKGVFLLATAALLVGSMQVSPAAAACATVVVHGRAVHVCGPAARQRLLGDAECWRLGPIQHCDYRPGPWGPRPWGPWCRGWGCRGW